jgi:secretion/DNA translocation related TadE-like protein
MTNCRRERGSVTIVAAGAMVLVAVLSLFCVDLLRAIEGVARAQTGADAAALAAAQELALPSGVDPAAIAGDYAGRNGTTLISCACRPSSTEAVVEVEVSVPFVLLGGSRTIHAAARAVVEGLGRAPGRT